MLYILEQGILCLVIMALWVWQFSQSGIFHTCWFVRLLLFFPPFEVQPEYISFYSSVKVFLPFQLVLSTPEKERGRGDKTSSKTTLNSVLNTKKTPDIQTFSTCLGFFWGRKAPVRLSHLALTCFNLLTVSILVPKWFLVMKHVCIEEPAHPPMPPEAVCAPVCMPTFLLRHLFASVEYWLFPVINDLIPFVQFSCFLSTSLSIYQSAGCWETNLSYCVKKYMIKFANVTV